MTCIYFCYQITKKLQNEMNGQNVDTSVNMQYMERKKVGEEGMNDNLNHLEVDANENLDDNDIVLAINQTATNINFP